MGADLVESYAESGVIVTLSILGSIGLSVAMIGAAVALRRRYRLGWASLTLMILSLPLIAVHEPPFGPLGLGSFILAILVFERQQTAARIGRGSPLEHPVSARPA